MNIWTNNKKERHEIVKAMDTIMKNESDEWLYQKWISFMPEEANENDYEDIAEDEEIYYTIWEAFTYIMNLKRKNRAY